MEHKHTNKLIGETSPYLLQHAHNPVNWYPWGEEALSLAKEQDKPILVSIGYSACHWCHVMERESFEDEQTANLMNELFVNIKIDREERPDLDQIFMDAVQAINGQGGWPLNVFLTPGCKPFFGGTYFPPVKAFNRPSWKEVLLGISKTYLEKKSEVESQAEYLTEHLEKTNSFGLHFQNLEENISESGIDEIAANIMQSADKQWGGFSRAPKFPQTFSIRFLMRYAVEIKGMIKSENNPDHPGAEFINQALLSIDKMINGGIYDHLGGGFARYSTDSEWLVPHFEKMLYDNALLISVISEAYQLTGDGRYKEVIRETIDFVKRELMDERGGFYAAIDADSEGEEGKFYVWNYSEVMDILGEDGKLFCSFYDLKPEGNWHEGGSERKNILWRNKSEGDFCFTHKLEEDQLKQILKQGREKLFVARNKRTRPGTDDKILLSWNALMNSALSSAYSATGEIGYKELAISNMRFILENFSDNNGSYFHSWKNGIGKHPAFLDDLAFLIQAQIQLYEITGDTSFLVQAKELALFVIEYFQEENGELFYFTRKGQNDILIRKKDIYDGAQPSGNSVMAENLYRLSVFFDEKTWKDVSLKMMKLVEKAITRYPVSFGNWACFLMFLYKGPDEIVVLGDEWRSGLDGVLLQYIPHKLVMADNIGNEDFPMFKNKKKQDQTLYYLCKDYSCLKPVSTIEKLLSNLRRK